MINQAINQNWAFYYGSGLNFDPANSRPTFFNSNSNLNTWPAEGCASISDTNGNLLFYTNGMRLWDGNHVELTTPATRLKGHPSSTQSSIIVPDPANDKAYYIFTVDGASHPYDPIPINHFNGVKLEQDANGNWLPHTPLSNYFNGAAPNTINFSPVEKLTAVPHANCKDYWVITMVQEIPNGGTFNSAANKDIGLGQGYFRIFLVTQNGVTHHKDIPTGRLAGEGGYLKASQDSTLLATADNGNSYPWGGVSGLHSNVTVYQFNNATGDVDINNIILVSFESKFFNRTVNKAYGLEFSPDGQYLYYASTYVNNPRNTLKSDIIQLTIDFNSPTPQLRNLGTLQSVSTRQTVGLAVAALQLGIDGVIYLARPGQKFLSAIENPNDTNPILTNQYVVLDGTLCGCGLPNLITSTCTPTEGEGDCGCGCAGCNEDAETLNEELVDRAKEKFNIIKANPDSNDPFSTDCTLQAINSQVNLEPYFYLHWGDGKNDQIEEHDTEVFYITICNPFSDIQYNGLQITKITLVPHLHSLDKIHIVPDRFVHFDCLTPCVCQTREFAMITRANDTAGNYKLEVEYCYESIEIKSVSSSGKVEFPIEITED